MKIYLHADEWYPIFTFYSSDIDKESKYGEPTELTQEEYNDYVETMEKFWKFQEKFKKAYCKERDDFIE